MSKTAISLQGVFCLPVKGHSPEEGTEGRLHKYPWHPLVLAGFIASGWGLVSCSEDLLLLWGSFATCTSGQSARKQKSWERSPPMIDRSWCLHTSASSSLGTGMACSSAASTLAAFFSWNYFPILSASPGFISGITASGTSDSEGGTPKIGVCIQQRDTGTPLGRWEDLGAGMMNSPEACTLYTVWGPSGG